MMNGHDTERARSALQAIPADLPREDWHRVGRAAIAAGLDVDAIDAWSSAAPNYKGAKDVQSAFRSIKPDGGTGPGTLFHLAHHHGWKDTAKPQRQATPRSAQPDAAAIWEQCEPASPLHGYIVAKRGNAEGLRQVPAGSSLRIAGHDVSGWLVVPCRTLAGELQTLQFIPPPGAGKKLNLAGASFGDGLHIVGEIADAACCYVVEGIGQAWACWQATGQPAAVCFGAGRMGAVVKAIKAQAVPLVLVPDVGKEAQAEAIAREHGCQVVRMPADKPANYDASDYAAEFGADALEVLLSTPAEPERRYKLRTAAELAALPPLVWLVRGVLPAEGLAALFGASGSGKTFLALDAAAAIAEGRRWFTYRVRPAPVVYVGLEGEAGLSQRVQAWDKHHGRPAPEGLRFVVSQPFDLLQPDDVAELAEACRGAGLVVLDTLNRAAPGVDENSSQDMGRIIEAAADLQRRIGGLVLLIHHAGKDSTKGMRGHSSLHAALDAAIEVRRDGDAREWRIAKSKDGADAESIPFRLEVVTLGIEPDGTPVSSCAVVADTTRAEVRKALPPKSGNQRIVWDALPDVLKKASREGMPECVPAGTPCIGVEAAIDALRGRLPCEAKRQTERAQQALTGLAGRGLLHIEGGWLWLA
ncbi:Primase 2 [Thiomonas sp. X19]|uniref:AAA family ATPase n=1 Tax=Thiomonas sp. X19 TaxID=1050370 RepID=UPI000B66FFC4|nr:AAA family ATPase [Thiomonas sp. X19]SCC95884.1 Primase 2 [Thiomonas sp. X19]